MRIIAYNIVALALIGLASLLVIMNKDGWGWCVIAAVIVTAVPVADSKES